jgi:glyoxylase-like metal-dependent hydrolase (beta-lactamase superfamily II)
MIEIIPGIHQMRIPIPNNPLGFTNTYLVRGTDGWLLIDAGWNSGEALASMKNQLAEIGLTFKDITRILATHVHADHYGLVSSLRQHTKAEILLHRLEKDVLLNQYAAVTVTLSDIEELFLGNGAPRDEIPMPRLPGRDIRRLQTPVVPDVILEGGETISTGEFDLRVIWTPGHAPGHVCLYEPVNQILFGGDHVLPTITPNISLMPFSGDNPLGSFMKSLEALALLEVKIVLPAHEGIYMNLEKRIIEIIRHHKQRNLEIQETLKRGPATAYNVSSGITWVPESGGIKYKDLPPMDKRMAVMETLAHLKAMLVDGEVESFKEEGIIYYKSLTDRRR